MRGRFCEAATNVHSFLIGKSRQVQEEEQEEMFICDRTSVIIGQLWKSICATLAELSASVEKCLLKFEVGVEPSQPMTPECLAGVQHS